MASAENTGDRNVSEPEAVNAPDAYSSRRPSVSDAIRDNLEHVTNPGADVETNKSLHQLAREGDYVTMDKVLSRVKGNRVVRAVNQLDSSKISVLHYAARYDHLNIVRTLIGYGADVNIKGDDGLTPLHFCARFKVVERSASSNLKKVVNVTPPKALKPVQHGGPGQVYTKGYSNNYSAGITRTGVYTGNSVILFLADHGAHVNQRDRYGLTPLHYAAMRGNDDAAKELLSCQGIDIECTDEQDLTPLHLACTYGQVETAEILIQRGADIKSFGEKRQTSLHKAAAVGSFDLVKLITDAALRTFGQVGIDELLRFTDTDQNTPLLLGVESGSHLITKHLLDLGADVNHFNKAKVYPLHLACTIGSLEIVKLLLNKSAKINCTNSSYQTPLLVASAYNHIPIMEYLIGKGSKIDNKDRDNFTPLLLASAEGNAEAVGLLLGHGADIFALDREDKSALYWAAAQNHMKVVEVLLKDMRYDNSPLHIAAERGFLTMSVSLLNAGADVDNKNEDEQTPLHLAAKEGKNSICKEILDRDKFAVNDEDSDSNTALHLACIHGHSRVVATLINAGADIEARNYYLWTPLDCAAAYGQPKCAKLLLDANSPIDPMDKKKTTPLHLTARYGHEKTSRLLIERGASLVQCNSQGHNALSISILHGKREVAECIIESEDWLQAMKSEFTSPITGVRETPLRLLIRQFPDLAKAVFDRCMITNLQAESVLVSKSHYARISTEDPAFSITFNYELLDDAYTLFEDADDFELPFMKLVNSGVPQKKKEAAAALEERRHSSSDDEEIITYDPGKPKWTDIEIWDEAHSLVPEAKPYSSSSTMIKLNHPLMIMVEEKRTDLLGHPLCMALVRHKWNSFGRYVYYLTLFLYLIFVGLLTSYIMLTPAPYSPEQMLDYCSGKLNVSRADFLNETMRELFKFKDYGYGTEEACIHVRDFFKDSYSLTFERHQFTAVGKWIILCLAIFHLLKELFQITQAKLTYFGIENLLEWSCYITAILFVWDHNECHQQTGIRFGWQWQIGALSITMTWLNLLSNVRKFPFLGIYVVMFSDVMQTFLKFSIICALFIIAFSLGFHTLLAEQENFGTVPLSMIKTAVMMIGEFEFDDLFFDNVNHDDFQAALPYRTTTLLFFLGFLCVMSIIVMNLLVGLAVDDIKAVQDNAVLQRLAMQVSLNLDVEKMLPDLISRKFMKRQETVYPNQRKNICSKIFQDDNTLRRIAKAVIEKGHETEHQRLTARQDEILDRLKSVKESVRVMGQEVEYTRSILKMVAQNSGIDVEEMEE